MPRYIGWLFLYTSSKKVKQVLRINIQNSGVTEKKKKKKKVQVTSILQPIIEGW